MARVLSGTVGTCTRFQYTEIAKCCQFLWLCVKVLHITIQKYTRLTGASILYHILYMYYIIYYIYSIYILNPCKAFTSSFVKIKQIITTSRYKPWTSALLSLSQTGNSDTPSMSIYMSFSLYLSVCLSVRPSLSVSLSLYVGPSLCLCLSPSLSVSLSLPHCLSLPSVPTSLPLRRTLL